MGAESGAIDGILGELGGLEGVGGATVGAAAFGLLAFRIGQGDGRFGGGGEAGPRRFLGGKS